MKSSEIYSHILEGAAALAGKELKYLSGNNFFIPDSIDEGRIRGSRNEGAITLSVNMIETYAKALETGLPIHIDTAMGGAGNERSALEALVAHLPNAGSIPRGLFNGKNGKHVVWFDLPINEMGQIRDVTSDWRVLKGSVPGDLSDLTSSFLDLAARLDVGLKVPEELFHRFAAALGSKRFLILSGLAGSGKTKLAQAFARWLTPPVEEGESDAHVVIPVGADWTGSDAILGYPDGLDASRYVTRPALELILRAVGREQEKIPHFLILDEMNLSHVERYFADLLSLIESNDSTELYQPELDDEGNALIRSGIDPKLRLPSNLFIIGTVNVDETTYMFSPKVLDRANVIEFRIERDDLITFLAAPRTPDLKSFSLAESTFGSSFVMESEKQLSIPSGVKKLYADECLLLFDLLSQHNAEFGYRVANEAARFMHFYRVLSGKDEESTDWFNAAMDAVIVQKLLPTLHGSRTKLEGLLWALAYACGAERGAMSSEEFLGECKKAGKAEDEKTYSPEAVAKALEGKGIAARYPLSFEKILRMYRKLIRDQFVTFAEA